MFRTEEKKKVYLEESAAEAEAEEAIAGSDLAALGASLLVSV